MPQAWPKPSQFDTNAACLICLPRMRAVGRPHASCDGLLTGDQEFDSPKTLAAFALGLGLFVITLVLNVIALHVIRRYREQYD